MSTTSGNRTLETVSIKIPASPEYLHVVRLVAAGLASRISFTLEDIEDLKIAVDELSAYVTGGQGRSGTLDISFTLGEDRIEIRGAGHYTKEYEIRTDLTEFSRMILDTVADSAHLEAIGGAPSFTVVKSRNR